MSKLFVFCTLFFLFSLPFSAVSQEFTEKGGFSLDANEEHYFLFVLANRPNDLQEVRGEITKYIWRHYPNARLKITQIQVDGELAEVPLIHIQAFPNKTEAMKFYSELQTNRPDFMQMGMTLDYFPLSKGNYERILRAKSLKGYKPFFQQNYR